MVRRILNEHGAKILRYAGVSCVGVTTGQLLLYFFFATLGWRAVVANTLAVAIATIPNYLLNRAWVWGKSGGHRLGAEILPFWSMAFVGLLLSNVLVRLAEQRWDSWVAINLANLVGFGMIWVVKYVVLDRVLFGAQAAPGIATQDANAISQTQH